MRCPHCQHDVPDNARYCPECGQPLGIPAGVRTLVDVHPEVRQN
ncbi:MAG: zinc ribbon domain-containing protein, partial [Chloroflexi bacterium]